MNNSILNPRLIVSIALIWISHFFMDTMLGIWPVYKSIMQFDLAKAGLIVALGAVIGEGSQLIFGTIADRGYRKWLIMGGLLASCAAAFLAYFSSSWALLIMYIFTCLGSAAFHPSGAGLMGSMIPARRGLLMGIFASGGYLGLACSQLLFTYTHSVLLGKSYLLAIPVILVIILISLNKLHTPTQVNKTPFSIKDFFHFFKRKDLTFLYIALVTNQSLMWALIFILPDVLKSMNHVDWVCFGGGHMCMILGGAAFLIPAGYLADKFSPRTMMFCGTLMGLFVFSIFLFFGNYSAYLTLGSLFLLGSSLSVIHPIGVSLGVKLVPDKPSTLSAFLMGMVWFISEAVGPGGVGIMSKFFESYAPVKALAVMGFLFFPSLLSIYLLPKAVQEKVQVA